MPSRARPRHPIGLRVAAGDMASNQLGGEVTEVATVPASEPAGPVAVHGSATSWWVQGSATSNPVVWAGPAAAEFRGQPGLGHAGAAGAAAACSPGGDSATDTLPAGWASATARRSGALSNGPRTAGAGQARDGTGCAGMTGVPQPAQ